MTTSDKGGPVGRDADGNMRYAAPGLQTPLSPDDVPTVDALPDTESAPVNAVLASYRDGAQAVELDGAPAMPGEQVQLIQRLDQPCELVDAEASVGRIVKVIAGAHRIDVGPDETVGDALARGGATMVAPSPSGGVFAILLVLNDTADTAAISGRLFIKPSGGKVVQPKAKVSAVELAGFSQAEDMSTHQPAAVTRNSPVPVVHAQAHGARTSGQGGDTRVITQTRGSSSVAICIQRQEAKRILEDIKGGYPIQASELGAIERAFRDALEFM